jgi:hypothetical protein
MASRQQSPILAGMALRRGDVADAAVPMLMVVPVHEARSPLLGSVQISEPFERELRPILRDAEQRLGEGIVVTHPRA